MALRVARTSRGLRVTQPPAITDLTIKKCFVDTTLFTEKNLAGVGIVLMNEEGLVMAAKAGLLNCTLDPYHVEVMACKEALSWIKDNSWKDLEVLSDCVNACNSINRALTDHSYTGEVLTECRLLVDSLQGVCISYVPRELNALAHSLAKSVGLRTEPRTWVLNPPICTPTFLNAISFFTIFLISTTS